MKSKAIKAIVAVIMAVTVAILCMPMSFAAELVTSGKCGESATWSFNEKTGELRIEGTGVVSFDKTWDQFGEANATPAIATLKTIVIADGITDISALSFQGCFSLTKITVPATVTGGLSSAFVNNTDVSEIVFNGTKAQWNSIAPDYLLGYEGTEDPLHELKISCKDGTIVVIDPTVKADEDVTEVPDGTLVTSGKCGESVTLSFNEKTGELKIEGTGVVERPLIWEEQFDESGETPAMATLKSVVIADGITDISTVSFQGCFSLTKITVPATVTENISNTLVNQTGVKEILFKGTAAQWNALVANVSLMGAENVKITCSDKVIEASVSKDDTAETTTVAENAQDSKGGDNTTTIIIIAVAAVVVIAIIAIVIVALKKKKN